MIYQDKPPTLQHTPTFLFGSACAHDLAKPKRTIDLHSMDTVIGMKADLTADDMSKVPSQISIHLFFHPSIPALTIYPPTVPQ